MQIQQTNDMRMIREGAAADAAALFRSRCMEKRWETLDILKCLCAFGVICIHEGFPGETGLNLKIFFRFAVPVFFMITGFFYKDLIMAGKQNKQIWKIIKLTLGANLFYFLWDLLEEAERGWGRVAARAAGFFTPQKLLNLLVANESPFKSHLWYLFAILYVLLLAGWLARKKKLKILIYISPLLLAGDLIFGKYSLALWHQEIDYIYVRNYLFVGIPYFALGYALGCVREKILARIRIRHMLLLAAAICFFAEMSIRERRLLKEIGYNASREHYISTTFLTLCVFLLFLGWQRYYRPVPVFGFLAAMGKNCSTLIYILHPAVSDVLVFALPESAGKIFEFYQQAAPLCVFAATALIAWICCGVRRVFQKIRME